MNPRRIPKEEGEEQKEEIWVDLISDGKLKPEQEILLMPEVKKICAKLFSREVSYDSASLRLRCETFL
jgi:hypothetical protein